MLISILIVTWNRKDDTIAAVRSAYSQGYERFEVIVVDNGSSDGTREALSKIYPEVKVIPLEINIGISAGRNVGIRAAQGDIIVCLDSDARFSYDMLESTVQRFKSEPALGIINSKIVDPETLELSDGPGWVYSEKQKQYQDTEFYSWSFSEGGAAIRKELIDRVGPFWDVLFFGCEGQELSLRAWDSGYKVLYYPKSVVYHRASPRMRTNENRRDCLFMKSSLSIYLVRYPWWMLLLFLPLKSAATLIRGAKRGYLREVFATFVELGRQLPSLMRERKPIKNYTALQILRLQRQHGPLSWNLASWLKYKA